MKDSTTVSLNIGVALISFAVLIVELSLIRIMDVILYPGTGYMALTSAMFALGLGGIYLYLFPLKNREILPRLSHLALYFSFAAPLVIPVFNALPFTMDITDENRLEQLLSWSAMYITLIIPFMIVGLILSQVFLSYSSAINRLYFFDLLGAGVACLFFIPLVPFFGPGGLLFVASSAGLIASFCFFRPNNLLRYLVPLAGLLVFVTPLLVDNYIEFDGHANKRNSDLYIKEGKRDFVKWDPVSKLDVFRDVAGNALLFSLDGGQQGSWLGKKVPLETFSKTRSESPETFNFGRQSAVHYLQWKKGINPEVLVIGASAGGDIRTALAFEPAHVEGVELVGAIVDAERGRYKDYGGGLYAHPKVTGIIGEGRSYLRASKKRYDIIQMFSNHTSSSVESGSGAAQTVYLQTTEAYKEYFGHLSEEGVMQINHHIYPRMLTTAAQAWYQMGRSDFWKHVLVIEPFIADTLPTILMKMQPWSKQEVDLVSDYMNRGKPLRPFRPTHHHPSEKVFGERKFIASFESTMDDMEGIDIMIGTYHMKSLPYGVNVRVVDDAGLEITQSVLPGNKIKNNQFAPIRFSPVGNSKGRRFTIELSATEVGFEDGFSVWLTKGGEAVLSTVPSEMLPDQMIVFNPIDQSNNLVPRRLLETPFPTEQADSVPWDLTPVSDGSPYFSMIRKYNRPIEPGFENIIDRNTAHLLNVRLRNGLPDDWLHLVVVAAVATFFAFVFIVLPLVGTKLKNNIWSGMGKDIFYFSSLGLGFIMIEVVFIQLFKKLIGFPTHTFVVVICTLLISAGVGSALSKRFIRLTGGRTWILFATIIAYGALFAAVYQEIFYASLGLSLFGRVAIAVAILTPLGFFLGMPFPLGILGLTENQGAAIPWAWALNGFFTVVGGFVAILLSITTNFQSVIFIALGIYLMALVVSRSPKSYLITPET